MKYYYVVFWNDIGPISGLHTCKDNEELNLAEITEFVEKKCQRNNIITNIIPISEDQYNQYLEFKHIQ